MEQIEIRKVNESDKAWIKTTLEKSWGAVDIISRGKKTNALELPAFIAIADGKQAGLITYHIENGECEIVTLDSFVEGKGIGIKLIDAVKEIATQQNCKRLWFITTNDNMHALAFYQKRGFHLSALFPSAMEEARKLKPQIPLIGNDGIPLRDELELEMVL